MFEYYQIMIVLLKVCQPLPGQDLLNISAIIYQFDYFAFLGLTMQLLILVLSNDTAQYALTIAAIPIVLVLLIACGIAVVREIRWCVVRQPAASCSGSYSEFAFELLAQVDDMLSHLTANVASVLYLQVHAPLCP